MCPNIVSCDVTVTVSRRFCGVSSTIVYYHFGRRATFDFRLEVYVQRVLYDVRRKTRKIRPIYKIIIYVLIKKDQAFAACIVLLKNMRLQAC